ncbi:MAG: single-stranded-DNA-specific exonuclease, single-stranded-DNA-specific exonuclease [Candidatus Parcubacteria bacterium]|jgi:single-stranded-DNA-specific exonuclease
MVDIFEVDELHPITRKILKNRGIEGKEEVYDFLYPSYEKHVGDPFEIYGMENAVNRILGAIRNGEKIAVYSDYDCDGVPGGVLLREFFDTIGYPVEIYIPHRHNEGYGVHNHAIDTLKEKGISLVITVDSGITNIEEVAYAKSIGVDFIVTDHHLPITKENVERGVQNIDTTNSNTKKNQKSKANNQELKTNSKKLTVVQVVPDAVAVLNSKQDACEYWDDMLCGCAVAWKLSCAILESLRDAKIAHDNFLDNRLETTDSKWSTVLDTVSQLPEGYEKWMLDLVGISTIADMVPLRKENRALAHFGLKVLRKTKRPGLNHIFNEQRVRKDLLTEDDIAFTIAPRINAASRMGDPIQAHLMLYKKDKESGEGYARDLEDLNNQRKSEVKDIVSSISFDHSVYSDDVVVVGDMSWGPGILGLIAQKIIDETGKPVFVYGQGENKDELKGSCRSLGDVSVVDLMAHASHEVFLGWGGHEGAGGFSVSIENIDKLRSALNEAIKHVVIKEIDSQEVVADEELSMDDVHDLTYKAIEILAPFGEGNPKPVFSFSNVTSLATKRFGKKGEHLEVMYQNSRGGRIKAIQFFTKEETEKRVGKEHTLLAHLEKSYFGGKTEFRLRIVEVR